RAGSIKFVISDGFVIDDSPVSAQGTLHVRPNQDTTYYLRASLGKAARDLGAVTVRMDTSACRTFPITEEDIRRKAKDAIPAEYQHYLKNPKIDAEVYQTGFRVRITSELKTKFDPQLTINMDFGLNATRGALNVTYNDLSVDIDPGWFGDAWLYFDL